MIDPFTVYSEMLRAETDFVADAWLGALKTLNSLPGADQCGRVRPGEAVLHHISLTTSKKADAGCVLRQVADLVLRERHRAAAYLDTCVKDVPAEHRVIRNVGKGELSAKIGKMFGGGTANDKEAALKDLKARGAVWLEVFGKDTIAASLKYLIDRRNAIAKVKVAPKEGVKKQGPTDIDMSQPGVLTLMQTAAAWRLNTYAGKHKQALVPLAVAALIEHAQVEQAHALWMNPALIDFRTRVLEAAARPGMSYEFAFWDVLGQRDEFREREDPPWIKTGPPPQRENRDLLTHVVTQMIKDQSQPVKRKGSQRSQPIIIEDTEDVVTEASSSKVADPKGKGKAVAVEPPSNEVTAAEAASGHLKGLQKAMVAVSKQTWSKAITAADTGKKERQSKGLDRMMYEALGYTWKVSPLHLHMDYCSR